MKLHKGDRIEVIKRIGYDEWASLEIYLNGFIQYKKDHTYMLKRCGTTINDMYNTLQKDESIQFTI